MEGLLRFRYNHNLQPKTNNANPYIQDSACTEFLNKGYDGFYFSKALHIYGLSQDNFHDIDHINAAFKEEYGFLDKIPYFFACDLFGNQFGFDSKEIVFFNLETCKSEPVAKNFEDWMGVIIEKSNYYSGESILLDWENVLSPIELNQRLVPRTPFVIGGEYSPKNMLAVDCIKTINYNASIARQIYNVPDGTLIELKVGTPPSS
jgi:hypothetical protein